MLAAYKFTGEMLMIEIRWHGRGGQGAVTSVEMLALSAIEAQKYAQGFPSFGPERRGAPVMAFNRIADKPIKKRSGIYRPDVVVVLDPSLIGLVNLTDGLKPDGILIVNTSKPASEIRQKLNYKGKLFTIDATRIAREELGLPITNTTMLGAVLKATKVLPLDSLKNPLDERFGRVAAKNMAALQRAYNEVKLAGAI
jgi:pyruvate ferredoxin oxidoreductase gamma subunit